MGRKLTTVPESAGPVTEKDVNCESAAPIGRRSVEFRNDTLGFVDELQDVPAGKRGVGGVIIGQVPQLLGLGKMTPEPLYFGRKLGQRPAIAALLASETMFQSAQGYRI